VRRVDVPIVYEVVDKWIAAALRSDDSLFTPGVPIWTAAGIDELFEHFNEAPDESGDSFETKFKRQLQGSSPRTYQLAAELVFVAHLVVHDTKGNSKRKLIDRILSWSPEAVDVPADLAAAMDYGLVKGGLSFKTLRPYQLSFFVEFIKAWKGMSTADQLDALADPWRFRAVLYDTPIEGGYAMRETLLHFVFPEVFEDIIARDHKKAIVDAFADLAGDPTLDVDHRLLEIRRALAEGRPTSFTFYDADLHVRWHASAEDRERWDQFIDWGRRLVEAIDFDAEERTYKLAIAQRMREARDAMLGNSPTWAEKLALALRKDNNLVHQIAVSRVLDWVKEEEAGAREALSRWRPS
jgi:hypothetical protein